MAVLSATILASFTCFLIWFQLGYVVWYLRFLNREPAFHRSPSSPAETSIDKSPAATAFPRVAVILCLRGADPSLPHCLQSLLNQDYFNWELHLVFDSITDPAIAVVQESLGQQLRPMIHTIQQRSVDASLKCQAICTVIPALAPDIQYLAFLDADTICDPHWLSDLIHPMISEDAPLRPVATTGNRWFIVEDGRVASYLRQAWNGAAIVQMALYDIAWGGSFAISKSAIQQTSLLHHWGQSFCEDTMLSRVLSDHELRLARVPSLICYNRESVQLSSAYRWIVRQLLTVRLYHPRWFLVQGHATLLLLVSLVAPLLGLLFLLNGNLTSFAIIALTWAAYQIVNYRLLQAIENSNLQILRQRGLRFYGEHRGTGGADELAAQKSGSGPQTAAGDRWNFLVAILLSQLVHPLACLQASLARKVTWRGVTYQIVSGKQIRLIDYRPYRDIQPLELPDSINHQKHSID